MVAKHFPLKSKEFPSGTPQYNEYISCLEKVSCAVVRDGLWVLLGHLAHRDIHFI